MCVSPGEYRDLLRLHRRRGNFPRFFDQCDHIAGICCVVFIVDLVVRPRLSGQTSMMIILAELRLNEGLGRIIGIESEACVPKPWNISRFEEMLGQEPHRTLLKDVFNVLVQRLGLAVADLEIIREPTLAPPS